MNSFRSSQELSGSLGCPREFPGALRSSQDVSGALGSFWISEGAPKSSQERSRTVRSSQDLAKASGNSHELPKALRNPEELPGSNQSAAPIACIDVSLVAYCRGCCVLMISTQLVALLFCCNRMRSANPHWPNEGCTKGCCPPTKKGW